MKILFLKCPKCENTMKYQSRDTILTNKRKICVYCGKSFLIRENMAINSE